MTVYRSLSCIDHSIDLTHDHIRPLTWCEIEDNSHLRMTDNLGENGDDHIDSLRHSTVPIVEKYYCLINLSISHSPILSFFLIPKRIHRIRYHMMLLIGDAIRETDTIIGIQGDRNISRIGDSEDQLLIEMMDDRLGSRKIIIP